MRKTTRLHCASHSILIVALAAGISDSLHAQGCDGDPGARLDVPATAAPGSIVTVRMQGPAGASGHFMVSLGEGPTPAGHLSLCLDFPLFCDHGFVFDARGHHSFESTINDSPDLIDTVFFAQFVVDGAPPRRSNGASCRITRDGRDSDASVLVPPDCSRTSYGLTPLDELGSGTYLGEEGGLWPGGQVQPPKAHREAGEAIAAALEPLDGSSRPSARGSLVVAGIGFSVSKKIWAEFVPLAQSDGAISPAIRWVDLCLAGEDAIDMSDPNSKYWTKYVPTELAANGVTAAQVQVLWILSGAQRIAGTFPSRARTVQDGVESLIVNAKARFPNAALAYLSPITYEGYAVPVVEPESYENGWAIKWAIETQLAGGLNYRAGVVAAIAPWLTWAYYPWCDGIRPRADGLDWLCVEDTADGVHPTQVGSLKIALRILDQWKRDPTAQPWLLRFVPEKTLPTTSGPAGAMR